MKGLLRNNFYSMSTNLQLSFFVAFVLIFFPMIISEKSIISVILAVQSCIFIVNIGTALNTDTTSKWSNFEITLPVKRNDIITARYISFLLLILCGILMSAITSILTVVVFKTVSINTIIFGFTFGISLSLLTASFMYPIMLKIGTEKNELIILICAAIAATLFRILLRFMTPFLPDNLIMNQNSLGGIILTVASMVVFILSYFVSRLIYQRKEL